MMNQEAKQALLTAADMQGLSHEFLELLTDAERYRWLKHNPQWLGWDHDFRSDEVEREIDAAMAEKTGIGAA